MKNFKILFVCLGNICRSPAAEAIMTDIVLRNDMCHRFEIDSAGIISYHEGELADNRMKSYAFQRGYRITSISRPVVQNDFLHFDYIIGMDNDNINALQRMAPLDSTAKIVRMTDFCTHSDACVVPDPYYGGIAGFALVIDILEDACQGLFDRLMNYDN